jgi:hypothetical protein
MLSHFSYPIICTDKFVQTVNFYEDFLGYVPAIEMKGYVVLKREEFENMYIAVIDVKHRAIPEAYRRPVQGMILSYPVVDVKQAYQDFYWEGLNILHDPLEASCGRFHFMMEDPNGILIDVSENIPLKAYEREDGTCEPVFVSDCV